MGTTSVRLYECDGPDCSETMPLEPKHQWPGDQFMRVTLRDYNGLSETGAFDDPKCALAWTRRQLGLDPVAEPEGPKDELELVDD